MEYKGATCSQDNKLHIKDIFDMVAGTSTGGVIAAALSVPNNDEMTETFSAQEILEVFKRQAPIIFAQQRINAGLIWIITIISTLIGGVLGHKRGKKIYANPIIQKNIRKLKRFLHELKKAREEQKKET